MTEKSIVHSFEADAEPHASVVDKLRAGGIEILSAEPNMLLVSASKDAAAQALGQIRGWKVSAESFVPAPMTRFGILKSP